MNVAQTLSFFLFALANVGLFIFVLNLLLSQKEHNPLWQAFGLLILTIAAVLNILNHGYSELTIWLYAISFFFLFIGVTLDKHSFRSVRYFLPVPLVAFYFFQGHALILSMAIFLLLAIVQIGFSAKHKRANPLLIAYGFMAAGEYYYYRSGENIAGFQLDNGAFLYILASLVILLWLFFFMVRKIYRLLKG